MTKRLVIDHKQLKTAIDTGNYNEVMVTPKTAMLITIEGQAKIKQFHIDYRGGQTL